MPNDAVYAVRQLRKTPAFACAAILTLAFGIGANTAIYQVLDAVLFRPLPVRDPARLVRVDCTDNGRPRTFTYSEYRDLAAHAPAFEGVLATSDFPLHAATLRGRGQAHTVNTVIVSANYFQLLGVGPSAGRVFDPADDRSPVAVISDAFWSREFQRSPAALGQTARINKAAITIIGVAPPRFSGEKPGNTPDLWVPMGIEPQLTASDLLNRPKSWLTVMARLRPGVTLAGAQRSLAGLVPGARVTLEPGAQGIPELRARIGRPVVIAMGAVALLLLIACCNLAGLLLARGAARSHEIAVRLSLGAGRARLVRQLVTESVVLAAIGGALALLVTTWLSRTLVRDAAWLGGIAVEFQWRVPAVTAAVTLLTAVLFGVAPALSATRPPSPRATRPAVGRALIAAQIAVSLVLLSGAGMLAHSLWNLRHQDFGFRPDGLVVADLSWEFSPAMMARYAAIEQPLLDRLAAVPGARSVALSGFGPLGDAQYTGPLSSESTYAVQARIALVSPRYFETTEIPILAGRPLAPSDDRRAPNVAVVTETAARLLFGGADAVGKLVSLTDAYDPKSAIQIVGVARDVRFANPGEPFRALIFRPLDQRPAPFTTALVRVSGDPGAAIVNVRAAFRAVDPDFTLGAVRTLPDLIDSLLGQERTLAFAGIGFAALALLLTAVGVYGSISYAVERRAREIGIRIALGAQRGQVSRLLLRDVAATASAGVLAGAAATAVAARALRALLFGVAPGDWSTTALAALLLAAIAGLAAYLPARRAARVDPVTTLRAD